MGTPPGRPGRVMPYFPYAGNGGYDVQHYDLDRPTGHPPGAGSLVGRLSGVATIDLRATQNLDRFNLDLRGLDVRAVTVDGTSARGGGSALERRRGRRCGLLAGRTTRTGCGS